MFKILSLAGALIMGASVAAADIAPPPPEVVAPDVFVKSLYDTKLESEAVSPELGRAMTDSLILTHFSAELLALYKTIYYVDEPVIDGDVFMMAQEWEPTDVATKTTAQTPEAATVEATFKIGAETRVVTYSLKALRNSWEIDDIASPEGSIRKWIGEAKIPAPTSVEPTIALPSPG